MVLSSALPTSAAPSGAPAAWTASQANGTHKSGAACSRLAVRGILRSPNGEALGHAWSVGAFEHARGKNLGWDRVNGKGRYAFSICKGKSLKRYARSRAGKIDLDFVARKHKKAKTATLVTTRALNLTRVKFEVKGKFTKARTFRASQPPRSPRPLLAVSRQAGGVETGDKAYGAIHSLHLMRMQAIRSAFTNYRLRATSLKAVTTEVSVGGGGFGASGSMTVGGSREFFREGKFTATSANPRRAQFIKADLQVDAVYTCYKQSIKYMTFVGAEPTCTINSTAAWTGGNDYVDTPFLTCRDGNSRIGLDNQRDTVVGAEEGTSYESRAGATGPIGGFQVKVVYGADTYYTYTLKQDRPRRYCLAGAGETVSESAALYLQQPRG